MIKAAAEHWRKVSQEAPVSALTRIEEAAKQLIGLTGTLQGIYFAVFAFSTVRTQVAGVRLLLFLAPVLFWFLTLFCATLVFVPQVREGADADDVSLDAWTQTRDTYRKTVNDKLFWLHWSHRLLVVSFLTVLMLLSALTFLPSTPGTGPTQIMIVTPTPLASPTP
jgi:hypothetical protein